MEGKEGGEERGQKGGKGRREESSEPCSPLKTPSEPQMITVRPISLSLVMGIYLAIICPSLLYTHHCSSAAQNLTVQMPPHSQLPPKLDKKRRTITFKFSLSYIKIYCSSNSTILSKQ